MEWPVPVCDVDLPGDPVCDNLFFPFKSGLEYGGKGKALLKFGFGDVYSFSFFDW